jgi:protocatechuate 3,4-dioxygenase beta subunit
VDVRDATANATGTASIKGRVLTTEGRPLRRATVVITGSELTTSTGLEGEFLFEELPAGRYTLIASRSGYLTSNYGQTRYGEPGTPIEVKNGESVEKIDFVLDRAGVISGRVVDETGEAAAGVQVWAMQSQYFRGSRRVVPVSGNRFLTDDAGNYRILALPPGEYVVMGILRDTWMSDEKQPRMLGYAPTYFPGTASAAEAQRIKIVAGQEAAAIDFALNTMRASTVSGSVVASNGSPLGGGSISLSQEMVGPSFVSTSMISSTRTAADGTWTLRDVAPGDYTLRASGPAGELGTEVATMRVSVAGTDVSGLVITTDSGVQLSGTVVTDSGEPLPTGQLTVTTGAVSMESSQVRGTPGKDDGVVGPDGTFVRRSPTGSVVVRVSGLPRGWGVKSVMIGNRDYAGAPIELGAGRPVGGITVVVSKRFPTVRGRIVGEEGTIDALAILFPVDQARWIEAGALTRTAKADRAGAFRIEAVRPGDYYAVAVPYVPRWQINDPEFLASLQSRATKVVVGEQEAVVDLKVVR